MALSSLTIEGFRAFRRLELPRLARVNLIVGSNNVGKTSLLEALQLLAAGPAFSYVLDTILSSRRELATDRHGAVRDFELLRVFHAPTDAPPCRRVELTSDAHRFSLGRAWAQPSSQGEHVLPNRAERFQLVQDVAPPDRNAVEVLEVRVAGALPIPLQLDGSFQLPVGWLEQAEQAALEECYLPANGFSEEEAARRWDAVVLHGEEDFLIEVLQIIAPDIERMFFIKARGDARTAYVRRTGRRNAEPLYSLGGGMRRLLDLALGLVQARGGLLLADEIENGIHYAVQPDLWSLLFEAATRLDVQVFATTHSWDCIEAFQQAAAAHPEAGELIRLHRSDSETGPEIGATIVDEDDLAIITRQAIEVR